MPLRMAPREVQVQPTIFDFLAGGGEAGALIRAHDWASHPLGPPQAWPQPLKTGVGLMLGTGHPMCLSWGEDLAFLYNDAYAAILATRHPHALGRPTAEVWADTWPDIAPLVERVLAGEAIWREDMHLVMGRPRRDEDTWWTLSYTPLRDADGVVRGFVNICNDVTGKVLTERRLTAEREALRDGEMRFRALVHASADVVYRMSPEWSEMQALDGRGLLADTDAPSVRWLDEYIFPEDRVEVGAAIAEAVRTKGVFELEHRLRRTDGTAGWTCSRAVPVIGHDGEIVEWFGMASDVTERRRTEAALAASRATLQAVYDNTPVGLIVAELPSGRLVEANRTLQTVFRHPMHPTESIDDYAVWESYDAEGRRTAATDYPLARTFATGQAAEGTYLFVRGDGSRAWLRVQAAPIRDASGTMTGGVVAVADVDEMMRTRAALESFTADLAAEGAARTAELGRFQAIVEATTSPICAFDTQFRLIAFNKAHNDEFRRVNGFNTKLGDVFPELFIPEQRPVMRALMARALSGEPFTVTEEFGRPELGQPLWEISYTPLRDKAGAVIGAFHLAKDISDRVRTEADLAAAQDALRQSQKMEAMGQLTGGVAHDFNNLLTPIVGALDLLGRKELGEREQRLIAGAAQSAERAKVLVQRLLAFARRQPLQPVAVDVAKLVQGMAELVASTTGPKIRVVVDLTGDLPFAKTDPNQLEMALLNLSVNARDAMPEGGTLRIGAAADTVEAGDRRDLPPGRYVRLWVADTGSGMDEGTLARAIEPFFSTKGVGKGTGLGLSMAHGFASQLGGGLTISSEPGRGATVELWLPQTEALPEPPTVAPRLDEARGRGTVLLVDDEEIVRLSTADMLGDLGYDVVQAASAEAALSEIGNGARFDLIVTDHLMPGMTGTDLARALAERRPALPILVVSGYAEIEGGVPDLPYLTKPFRKDELAASLARLARDA